MFVRTLLCDFSVQTCVNVLSGLSSIRLPLPTEQRSCHRAGVSAGVVAGAVGEVRSRNAICNSLVPTGVLSNYSHKVPTPTPPEARQSPRLNLEPCPKSLFFRFLLWKQRPRVILCLLCFIFLSVCVPTWSVRCQHQVE